MAKSLLIITRQPPWAGPSAREALDIVLAGGAFDLPIGLLFLDDGVFQLAPAQNPSALQQKDLTANLKALEMFGIEDVYVCAESLTARGMTVDPANGISPLNDGPLLAALINGYDQVITI
ncbi:sulfurtransferase complex subunit TusC [Pseudomonas sp. JDS28PS106]|uniref:sulfurtransferase complex subunit TusC n=1 Tax=Pseudomonas sp. JDS28PS106 TaxID=2497235 RepID=UPI002FD4BD0B